MSRTLSLPPLRDRHSHVSIYAALGDCPSILGLPQDEALLLLRGLPRDGLSIVVGWYSARVTFTPEELASLPPVVIVNYSLHGMLLSDRAKDRLRRSDPELVERHADPRWCELNLAAVLSLYGRLAGLDPEKLAAFMERLAGLGVGLAEDMLILDERSLDVIRASPWGKDLPCWADPGAFQGFSPRARQAVAGFKLFLDGALALHTAALSEPYLQGGLGTLLHSDEALQERLAGLARLGKPVAIHAIGGRAIEQALAALERLDRDGLRLPSVRLEHVQFIIEAQARRAKELGLALCMQPNFSVESRDYADRLPPALLRSLNPFRMLIDRMGFVPGRDLLLGSDGMPHGVEAAWQWGLFPLHESQRLTSDELAQGYGPAVPGGRTVRLLVDEERRLVRKA
ncbi:MAG: amidohydrolase family protein [Elusimicrobia bacterium]|nr:amidohydrolase family protein [Elusimicrobiota bacterium]